MDFYIVLSLIMTISLVVMGINIFHVNIKSRENIIFAVICIIESWYTRMEILGRNALNSQFAQLLLQNQFTYPLIVALFLHFILIYSKSGVLKYKFIYAVIYIPALLFCYESFAVFSHSLPVYSNFGFTYLGVINDTFINYVEPVWVLLVCAVSVWLLAAFLRKDSDHKKVKTAIILAAFILLAADGVTVFLEGIYRFMFPDIRSVVLVFMSVLIFYSLKKYRIFKLNPSSAAEKIIATMPDIFLLTDMNDKIVSVNNSALSLLGYTENDLKDRSVVAVFGENNFENNFRRRLKNGENLVNYETMMLKKDKIGLNVNMSVSILTDRKRKNVGIVYIARDVTENLKMNEKIIYNSTHDKITDLANRLVFEERLIEIIAKMENSDMHAALLYLDLDEFKIINDTSGHTAGNQFLMQISDLLKLNVRGSDVIARLGGDEFGILLDNCSIEKASEIAEKICRQVREFRFVWEDKTYTIGFSIGVVGIDKNSGDIDKILSTAISVCDRVKENGGNKVCIYGASLEKEINVNKEKHYLQLIRKGLEGSNFKLFYQNITPVINSGTVRIHCELLLRLTDDDGNIIAPNIFLPIAQKYRLINAIDRWVITAFFRFFSKNLFNSPNYMFNINLTGATLNDNDFFDFIQDLFGQYRIPPQSICFEITENSAISNFSKIKNLIAGMKKMGCFFALDDFGSGLSSFNYLKYLPVDFLKIDGSFVKDIMTNDVDFAIVKSANEIGHLMNLKTIAEYVENESIFGKLRELNIDFAQGYFFSKPSSIENILK
jgi:diguanylate cyclase (GGDEF)-like protein/PAS domain S-box-containing protein